MATGGPIFFASRHPAIFRRPVACPKGSLYPAAAPPSINQALITAEWGHFRKNNAARELLYSLRADGEGSLEPKVAKWERLWSAGATS